MRTVLVAMVVEATDHIERITGLLEHQLPGDREYVVPGHGRVRLDCWWVAEDDRLSTDADTEDSAIFVGRGNQVEAREVICDEGLDEPKNERIQNAKDLHLELRDE